MHQVRSIFDETEVHFFGVTETWLSASIRNSSVYMPNYNIFRNDRHDIWKHNRTDLNWSTFKRHGYHVNALVDIAKKNYYELWRNIDEVGLSNKNDESQIIFAPETLNDFFLSTQNASLAPNKISFCAMNPSTGFSFQNVSSSDVEIAICSLKSNAIGLDEIPHKFIKLVLPTLLPHLTHIFNFILASSQLPTIWKQAKLIPIGKKHVPTTPKDYRPISILSSL